MTIKITTINNDSSSKIMVRMTIIIIITIVIAVITIMRMHVDNGRYSLLKAVNNIPHIVQSVKHNITYIVYNGIVSIINGLTESQGFVKRGVMAPFGSPYENESGASWVPERLRALVGEAPMMELMRIFRKS